MKEGVLCFPHGCILPFFSNRIKKVCSDFLFLYKFTNLYPTYLNSILLCFRTLMLRCSRMLRGDSDWSYHVRRLATQGILGLIRTPLFPWHKTAFSWATYWDKPVSSWVMAWQSAGRLYVSLDKHAFFCYIHLSKNMISMITKQGGEITLYPLSYE